MGKLYKTLLLVRVSTCGVPLPQDLGLGDLARLIVYGDGAPEGSEEWTDGEILWQEGREIPEIEDALDVGRAGALLTELSDRDG